MQLTPPASRASTSATGSAPSGSSTTGRTPAAPTRAIQSDMPAGPSDALLLLIRAIVRRRVHDAPLPRPWDQDRPLQPIQQHFRLDLLAVQVTYTP